MFEREVERRHANDLTRPLFVFKIIEMMKSCEMHSLADDVVSYVGTNNPL